MADEHCLDRRSVLGTAAGAGAIVAGVGTVGGIGTDAGSGGGRAGDDAPRKLVVRDVEFFDRGVVGQYVLVTDPAGEPPEPGTTLDCPFVDWPASATRRYQGLLLDRLTDRPHATRVPVYANAERADVTVGTPYVVDSSAECGAFVGLAVVPVETTDATGNGTAGNATGRNGTADNATDG